MKNNIKTSIVIRTHNNDKFLERLFKKIKIQKKFKNYEIIVIDSFSKDNTLKIAKEHGCRIFKINPKKFTHASTFNLGAEKSKGEIVFFVSADIIPKDEFWAYNLIKHFEDKKVGGVFSKQEPIKNLNTIEEFKIKKIFPEKGRAVAFFSNASGAIRRSVWKKIKYNENVPYQHFGGEDQILAKEIQKKGYKILYEPKSVVYHSHKYSIKSRLNSAYMKGLNKEKVEKWKEDMYILKYKKQELIKYLIKKGKFKELFWDLLFVGILLRLTYIKGKLEKK